MDLNVDKNTDSGVALQADELFQKRKTPFLWAALVIVALMALLVYDMSRVKTGVRDLVDVVEFIGLGVALAAVLRSNRYSGLGYDLLLSSGYRPVSEKYQTLSEANRDAVDFISEFRPSTEGVRGQLLVGSFEVQHTLESKTALYEGGISELVPLSGNLVQRGETVMQMFNRLQEERENAFIAAKAKFQRQSKLARSQGYLFNDDWKSYELLPAPAGEVEKLLTLPSVEGLVETPVP